MKWMKKFSWVALFAVLGLIALNVSGYINHTVMFTPQISPFFLLTTPACAVVFAALSYKFKRFRIGFLFIAVCLIAILLPLATISPLHILEEKNANYFLHKGNLAKHDKVHFEAIQRDGKKFGAENTPPLITLYFAISSINAQRSVIINEPENFREKLHERELCYLEEIKRFVTPETSEDVINGIEKMRQRALRYKKKYPEIEIIRRPNGSCLFANPANL